MTSRTPTHASPPAWRTRLATACLAACVAALAAAAGTVAVYQGRPELRLGMDRTFPPGVAGFHPLERQGQTSFAWSRGSARLEFDHVDRRAPWACRADVINWRPPVAGPARVRILSRGAVLVDRLVVEPTASAGLHHSGGPGPPRDRHRHRRIADVQARAAGPQGTRPRLRRDRVRAGPGLDAEARRIRPPARVCRGGHCRGRHRTRGAAGPRGGRREPGRGCRPVMVAWIGRRRLQPGSSSGLPPGRPVRAVLPPAGSRGGRGPSQAARRRCPAGRGRLGVGLLPEAHLPAPP